MEVEEILQLDRCPFDYGAMGGELERRREDALLEEETHFVLFLRYMDRFISQCGFQVPVPVWNSYIRKKGIHVYFDSTGQDLFVSSKRKVMTELLRNIMVCCGWGIGSIRLKETGQFPELFPAGIVSIQEWERIFSYMPGFHKLGKQGFREITVTVCWNRALYDYHEFSQKNEGLIRKQFPDAAEVIVRILKKTADPFALGLDGAMSCFKDQKYIMGFFEANHPDMTVSILDMDYNFMVQILILHMLVSCAENQFGYRQRGKEDGKI